MSNNFKIIGIMSGTSLDGVDIAHCTFKKNKNWTYKIDKAKTVEYPSRLKNKLKSCFELKSNATPQPDKEYLLGVVRVIFDGSLYC